MTSTGMKLSIYDPASQYQTQKIIQNSVRVPSSLYTMNLGALNVYQTPLNSIKVNWNQMSDRRVPHKQPNSGNSQGSFYHGSSRKHTQTRDRPGACSPGGIGVDIKHNSYHRYLSRIKAEKPIRRGIIPPTYGTPIVFNPAFPIYGGKTVKTSINNNAAAYICNNNNTTPDGNAFCSPSIINEENISIYKTLTEKLNITSYSYVFTLGQTVFSRENDTQPFEKSVITEVLDNNYYKVETTQLITYITYVTNIIPKFFCNNNTDGILGSYEENSIYACTKLSSIYGNVDEINYLTLINEYISSQQNNINELYYSS
jgi:hypothetical protein